MPAKARFRQLWIKGAERPCLHAALDRVATYDGKPLAELCKDCGLKVAEYGPCGYCGRERRCTHFVAHRGKPTRYCSPDCHQQQLKDEREAKASKGV